MIADARHSFSGDALNREGDTPMLVTAAAIVIPQVVTRSPWLSWLWLRGLLHLVGEMIVQRPMGAELGALQ